MGHFDPGRTTCWGSSRRRSRTRAARTDDREQGVVVVALRGLGRSRRSEAGAGQGGVSSELGPSFCCE